MTTDKPAANQLTTQGKGVPETSAPPQTIIQPELVGTYGKLGPKSDMYDPIIPPAVDGGAEGIMRVVNSIDPEAIVNVALAGLADRVGPWAKDWEDRVGAAKKLEEAGIIPPTEDQHAQRKLAEDVLNESFKRKMVEADQRRQTVQAEAMVNLAVGVVLLTFGALTDVKGKPISRQFKVCLEDLAEFQNHYTVTQEIQSDGGFIISVTPKEV